MVLKFETFGGLKLNAVHRRQSADDRAIAQFQPTSNELAVTMSAFLTKARRFP